MKKQEKLDRIWESKPKIALKHLNKDTVLIEGNSAGLKFLGLLLTLHSDASDCGIQFSKDGAGRRLFRHDSTLNFYIHKVPCGNRHRRATQP